MGERYDTRTDSTGSTSRSLPETRCKAEGTDMGQVQNVDQINLEIEQLSSPLGRRCHSITSLVIRLTLERGLSPK
jgi:hypothetical protein